MIDRVTIPKFVRKLMSHLIDAGFSSHIVGGCVRDQLLGRKVKDYDVTTSATPEEMKIVFKDFKILSYGEKHGTQVIRTRGENIEITTYRIEGRYSDGRRPDNVQFVRNLNEDLKRRDFTINAIAADIEGVLLDPFGGVSDIVLGLIRAVGNPIERFTEDSLRILRACRFSLRYDFKIEPATIDAIQQSKHLISEHKISAERIYNEMSEILCYDLDAFEMLVKLDLLGIIFGNIIKNDKINTTSSRLSLSKSSIFEVNFAIILYDHLDPKIKIDNQLRPVFRRMSGMGTFKELIILALLKNGKLEGGFVNYYSKIKYTRYYELVTKDVRKKKIFDVNKFVPILIQYNQAFADINTDLLEAQLLDAHNLSTVDTPVDGNDMKDIGCRGRQISSSLSLCRSLYQKDRTLTKQDLVNFIENIFSRSEMKLDMFYYLYNEEVNGVELINYEEINRDIKFATDIIKSTQLMVIIGEKMNLNDRIGDNIKNEIRLIIS